MNAFVFLCYRFLISLNFASKIHTTHPKFKHAIFFLGETAKNTFHLAFRHCTAANPRTDPLFKWKLQIFRMISFFWNAQQTHDIPVVVGRYDTVLYITKNYILIFMLPIYFICMWSCVCVYVCVLGCAFGIWWMVNICYKMVKILILFKSHNIVFCVSENSMFFWIFFLCCSRWLTAMLFHTKMCLMRLQG